MGQVVSLFREVVPASSRTTMYCVQPYWRERFKLVCGRRRDFKTLREGMAAARSMAQRYAAASVFVVRGDPEVGDWDEPELIVTFGDPTTLPG